MINNLFEKSERSSFSYWFAHWCAYNMVALKCGHWLFKYLFHDFEKPWLKLFLPYKKVQKLHRKWSNHHLSKFIDGDFRKADWYAMIIDWECSRYTKLSSPRTAYEMIPIEIEKIKDPADRELAKSKLLSTCRELKLII